MPNEMVVKSIEDLQRRLDEITQRVQKENDEKAALEKARTDIAKGMTEYQKSKDAAKKESDDADSLKTEVGKQCTDKEVIKAVNEARTKLEEELDALTATLATKQSALSGPQAAAEAADAALVTKKKALDDTQLALVDLSKNIVAVTKRLTELKKAAREALAKCDCVLVLILQHDIEKVQTELTRLISEAYEEQLWLAFSEAYKAYSTQVTATSDAHKTLLATQHEIDVAQRAVDDKKASFNNDIKSAVAKEKAKC